MPFVHRPPFTRAEDLYTFKGDPLYGDPTLDIHLEDGTVVTGEANAPDIWPLAFDPRDNAHISGIESWHRQLALTTLDFVKRHRPESVNLTSMRHIVEGGGLPALVIHDPTIGKPLTIRIEDARGTWASPVFQAPEFTRVLSSPIARFDPGGE